MIFFQTMQKKISWNNLILKKEKSYQQIHYLKEAKFMRKIRLKMNYKAVVFFISNS